MILFCSWVITEWHIYLIWKLNNGTLKPLLKIMFQIQLRYQNLKNWGKNKNKHNEGIINCTLELFFLGIYSQNDTIILKIATSSVNGTII
jgi:hypothetical protein